jgi:hypothetical protein
MDTPAEKKSRWPLYQKGRLGLLRNYMEEEKVREVGGRQESE